MSTGISTGISDRARARITTAVVSTSLTIVLAVATLLIVDPPRHATDPTTDSALVSKTR